MKLTQLNRLRYLYCLAKLASYVAPVAERRRIDEMFESLLDELAKEVTNGPDSERCSITTTRPTAPNVKEGKSTL